MFGIILVTAATFFDEITCSIGKFKVARKEESIYSMAFLNIFWGTVIFGALILFRPSLFVFSTASWPTFGPRLFLEILQMYLTVNALSKADRSTFSFLRLITIPLLLITDLMMGYILSSWQVAGILILTLLLAIILDGKQINKKGAIWVIIPSLNAVATISLYKYDIANFNSVVAEQFLVLIVLLAFSGLMARLKNKENPLGLLRHKVFFIQSFSQGIGTIMESFAYVFIPASVVMAVKRSTSLFWSIISGRMYFKERHFLYKMFLFLFVVVGLFLLAF